MTPVFYAALAERAAAAPGGAFLRLPERTLSFDDVLARADEIAGALAKRGVRPADRVGLFLGAGPEALAAFFALSRLGAVAVHLYEAWKEPHLRSALSVARIRAVVAQAATAGLVPADFPAVHAVEDLRASRAGPPAAPGDDVGVVFFTSGSTGWPKAVAYTEAALFSGARGIVDHQALRADDRILWLFPLSFTYGLNQITSCLLTGASLVLDPSPAFPERLATARRRRVTVVPGTPETFAALERMLGEGGRSLPDLRLVTNSGGAIPPDRLARLPELLPGVEIHLTYGLTESLRVTALPPALLGRKPGSIGRPVAGVEVVLADEAGRPVAEGEEGEILVRSAGRMDRYLGDPEATRERFVLRPGPVGPSRWLRTGDLARPAGDGDLHLTGRRTAFLKCRGVRASTSEIEEVVLASRLVADAVAVGVPDVDRGQVVHLAVTTNGPRRPDREALVAWCRRRMPAALVPAAIHAFPGDLPRLRAGKPDRPAILESVLAKIGVARGRTGTPGSSRSPRGPSHPASKDHTSS